MANGPARSSAVFSSPMQTGSPSAQGLFSFIWRHSARDQLLLLVLTCASFPLLYIALSLPKLILNGAIGGNPTAIDGYLPGADRLTLLWVLSGLLLALIVANGVLKMRLNIYRGILGERLIRRLRFVMIERLLSAPPGQAGRISQGEAIAMVAAETEPLTGVMGDAFAQPVFQLGQMLTIIAFLFMQNIWLGVAGTSLIPLQAYLIPHMQRAVNRLHRRRVAEMRLFSETISESVAGASSLRIHGGLRYRLAQFSDQLHRLFEVRREIFRRKFFIKFVNNLLTQITPFLFYALGGYLVIHGSLSFGALVAAIAAVRDIADPWRELLTYWNAAQEGSSRFAHLMSRLLSATAAFAPPPVDPADTLPTRLTGDILFANVTVLAHDGTPILQQIDFNIPGGALIGLEVRDDTVRQALADLMTGERQPDFGSITIGGCDIRSLSTRDKAARIGLATSVPFVFRASVAENTRMPMRRQPQSDEQTAMTERLAEARRSGNSTDLIEAPWNDGGASGLDDEAAVDRWSIRIVNAIGASDEQLERALGARLPTGRHGSLDTDIVACRPLLARRLSADGLSSEIEPFVADRFSAALTLGENLLFAVRRRDVDERTYHETLRKLSSLEIADPLLAFAGEFTQVLVRAFGDVGPEHPLLRRVTSIGAAQFEKLAELSGRLEPGRVRDLAEADRIALLELAFQVTGRDLGTTMPAHLAATIVAFRRAAREWLDDAAADEFEVIAPDRFNFSQTVLENLLGGMVRSRSTAQQRGLKRAVMDFLVERRLDGPLRRLVEDFDAGPQGDNLGTASKEYMAVTRALIRKPDVLILNQAFASAAASDRGRMWMRMRELMPNSTMLVIDPELPSHDGFDQVIRIRDGRLEARPGSMIAGARTASLLVGQEEKVATLSKVFEFHALRRAQLELLAYASDWRSFAAGDYAFRAGDPTDGVYVVTEGKGELRYPEVDYTHDDALDEVWAGRMIGDLSVILDGKRMASLVAVSDMTCLKIGEREFRDIFENDMGVALTLLRTISGHLHVAVQELDLATRR